MTDTMPRVGTRANCKNCGRIIIFEPYYCDGKPGPNPAVWFHLPGDFLCWVTGIDGKRGAPKRYAEPSQFIGTTVDVRAILPHLEAVRGRIRLPELRLTAVQWEALNVARAPTRSRNPAEGSLRFLPRTPVVLVATVEESTPYLEGWLRP